MRSGDVIAAIRKKINDVTLGEKKVGEKRVWKEFEDRIKAGGCFVCDVIIKCIAIKQYFRQVIDGASHALNKGYKSCVQDNYKKTH